MSYTGTDMVIEALGVQPVVRHLGRVKHRVEDWTEVWPEVFQHLERTTKRQFDSQGVYGGGSQWAELADSTKARKRAMGWPQDILRAEGRLEDSLLVDDHPEHIELAATDHGWWGTSVPYAHHHQDGTDLMPQRMIIQPPEGSRTYMVRILQRYALANAPTPIGAGT